MKSNGHLSGMELVQRMSTQHGFERHLRVVELGVELPPEREGWVEWAKCYEKCMCDCTTCPG